MKSTTQNKAKKKKTAFMEAVIDQNATICDLAKRDARTPSKLYPRVSEALALPSGCWGTFSS